MLSLEAMNEGESPKEEPSADVLRLNDTIALVVE